eukprot:jgi/Galph1/2278/GphlegSOOS_G918.1
MAQTVREWLQDDPEFITWFSQKEEEKIAVPIEEGLDDLSDSAIWSVSSSKVGNGVDKLRDGKIDTFWQSDGILPHVVNIQFNAKTRICELRLFLDYRYDESYTPQKIAIRTGNYFGDLKDILHKELTEPQGWVCIPLCEDEVNIVEGGQPLVSFVQASLLQIVILSNYQSGKDTHIRQIQVIGFKDREKEKSFYLPKFQTIDFLVYQHIR